jgi:hypothetical protein
LSDLHRRASELQDYTYQEGRDDPRYREPKIQPGRRL